MIKSHELRDYSYLGLGDFFSGIDSSGLTFDWLFFSGLTLDILQVQFISFVKRKVNSTSEQQKCKDNKKCDRLLSSKV